MPSINAGVVPGIASACLMEAMMPCCCEQEVGDACAD
jgi:hypothetical protein